MLYLADPAPAQTAQPYDDSALKAAVDILKANEAIDDQTVSALETLVKVKDAAHDQAIAQLIARVDAIPTQTVGVSKAEIDPIFDPLPTPQPIVAPGTMNGATLVSGVTGSPMVNGGKVHTFGRLSTPPAPNTWNTTLTISPVTGACKLRFAITSAIQGTIEVSIDGAASLTASNVGFGWSGTTPAIVAFQNPDFTWFEVAIPQSSNSQSVKITIPTGRGQLPTIYSQDAITSLIPTNPTGLKLRAMPGGEELPYRPGEFAKLTDIPDPTPLAARVTALESAPQSQFSKVADTKWFDTFAETNQSYKRKASRASTTSISFEILQSGGSIRQFALTDFTGFAYSGFGNGAGDPNGVTKAIPGSENVLIIWDGTGETLSIIVTNVGGIANYQIRKVRVNGQPLDWLSVYEPPIPTVPKDKLSYIVNGGAQDQAVPVNGTVLLDTVNKLINPDNLTDLAFVANGRVVFPVDGRVSVTGTFYRTTATGVVEPVLFVYKGSSATTKMQFNQTGIMANASSCHLQCGEFFVNAGDTMAILCPQACTVWKANCRLSVVYV